MALVEGAPRPRRLLLWTFVALCLASAALAPLIGERGADGGLPGETVGRAPGLDFTACQFNSGARGSTDTGTPVGTGNDTDDGEKTGGGSIVGRPTG